MINKEEDLSKNTNNSNEYDLLWGLFFIFIKIQAIINIISAKKLITIALSTKNTFEITIGIIMFIMMLFLFCWTLILNYKMFNFKK